MSKRYGGDYEIGRIQTFINKSKDIQIKKKVKELEDKIKELKFQFTCQTTQ